MSDTAAAVQNLNHEQKKLFNKKLEEGIAGIAKKLGEEIEKYQEDPYVYLDGMKIKKCLNQCIPATKEEREEYLRYKAARNNKQLINFIDKVFFEDGALQLEKRGIRK